MSCKYFTLTPLTSSVLSILGIVLACCNVGGIWQKEVSAGYLLICFVTFLLIVSIAYPFVKKRIESNLVHSNLKVRSVDSWDNPKALYLVVNPVPWLKKNRYVSIIATQSDGESERCIALGTVDHEISSGLWQILVSDQNGSSDEVRGFGYKLLRIRPYVDA